MQVDDSLAAFGGEQEPAVFLVVHEQILGQNRRAKRMLQHIKRRLNVRVPVGIVRADLLPGEFLLGSEIQTIGNVVRFRVPREGVGAPAPAFSLTALCAAFFPCSFSYSFCQESGYGIRTGIETS